MSWRILAGHQLDSFSALWQSAKTTAGLSHPVLEADFLVSAQRLLTKCPERIHLAVHGPADAPDAALLLERIDACRWRSFSTAHIPLTTACVPARSLERNCRFMESLFAALPGTPLVVKFVNADPEYFPDPRVRYADRVEAFQTHQTVRIDVAGSFEAYWDSRSKNLRRNLRGIQNKLAAETVPIRLAVLHDADDMNRVIEQHGLLERSGWKNVSGTPLTLESNEGAFYDSLLKRRAQQQRARVYQLYLGERLAASQLAVLDGSTLALLKTSYASDLSRFAPGRLLDYCMLEQIFAEGLIQRVEYCTIANDDDLRWSTSHRGVFEINLFRWPVLLGAASAVRRGRDSIRSLRSGSRADVAVT